MTRRDWKLGEVCEHGSLGRKCDRCDRDEDIAELREDRTLLLAVLKAAREIDIAEEGWERQMFILQGCVTACQHIMTDTPKPVTREPVEITGVSNPTADMEREIAVLRDAVDRQRRALVDAREFAHVTARESCGFQQARAKDWLARVDIHGNLVAEEPKP